ncbi:heterokaryon incompatibility protein s [Nemania sp. FL0916]|nr:heterokaryon incompatibility protein s [Nemania sp. FL0916]
MAEIFGVIAGALSVAALFNNCVASFEYIQLGRHFAQDYERCQLKIDIAQANLSRWGQAIGIDQDSRFATDNSEDESVSLAQEILVQIGVLLQTLEDESKRYTERKKRTKTVTAEDLEHLQVQNMQPVAQRLHSRFKANVSQRQKGTSFVKKAAWALYDGKNFEKLVNEVKGLVGDLEKLFPPDERVRHTLVEMEIEEVDDEQSLQVLQNAAADTDSALSQVVSEKLQAIGGNYAGDIQTEDSARVRVGNEWAPVVLTSGHQYRADQTRNEAGSIKAGKLSAVHIGTNYGGRGIFDN